MLRLNDAGNGLFSSLYLVINHHITIIMGNFYLVHSRAKTPLQAFLCLSAPAFQAVCQLLQ